MKYVQLADESLEAETVILRKALSEGVPIYVVTDGWLGFLLGIEKGDPAGEGAHDEIIKHGLVRMKGYMPVPVEACRRILANGNTILYGHHLETRENSTVLSSNPETHSFILEEDQEISTWDLWVADSDYKKLGLTPAVIPRLNPKNSTPYMIPDQAMTDLLRILLALATKQSHQWVDETRKNTRSIIEVIAENEAVSTTGRKPSKASLEAISHVLNTKR